MLFALMWLKFNAPGWLIWLWNIWGMLCLLAILVIAVATAPMMRAFGDEPARLKTWVLFFPYVWLLVVMIALTSHLLITRKLLQQTTQPREAL
jgi:hypothetical protein